MKRWLLAAAVLLAGSVTTAQADYIVLIFDLAKKEAPKGTGQPGGTGTPTYPQPGGPPMQPSYQQLGTPTQQPYPQPGGGMGVTGNPAPTTPKGTPTTDFDGYSTKVVAVIEINEKLTDLQISNSAFGNPKSTQPLKVTGKFGKIDLYPFFNGKDQPLEVVIIQKADKPLADRLRDLMDKAGIKSTKDKPEKVEPVAILTLAEWLLQHAMLTEFTEVMDQFAQVDKTNPSAIAYLQVKKDLEKATENPKTNVARDRLLKEYKPVTLQTSPHYVAFHKERTEEPAAVKARLNRLEKNLRSYYFWYALRGVALPVPTERQPIVVTFRPEEYKQLQEMTTATPEVAESFIARREGLVVFASKRHDEAFASLEKFTASIWAKGFSPEDALRQPEKVFKDIKEPYEKASYQGFALLQTTLENEGERAGVTHDGTRQLLYASGILNRHVVAPEWVQFGLGSFFETPFGSPTVSTGALSAEYLPLWKELRQTNNLGKMAPTPGAAATYSPAETLRKVVTDDYFRQVQKDGSLGNVRRARSTAWALTYYLMHKDLAGLQRYQKELAKMPRDLELDDKVLLTCFCKSMNLMIGEEINEKKFVDFANAWDDYMWQQRMELENVVQGVYGAMKKVVYVDETEVKSGDTAKGTLVASGPFHPATTPNTAGPGQTYPQEGPGYRPQPGYNPGAGQQYPPQPPQGPGGQQYPPQPPQGPGGQQYPPQPPQGPGGQQQPPQPPQGPGGQQQPPQGPGGQQYPPQPPQGPGGQQQPPQGPGGQQFPPQPPQGPGGQQLPPQGPGGQQGPGGPRGPGGPGGPPRGPGG